MKIVRVIAAPGRLVPIHPRIAAGVGDLLLKVDDANAVDLPDSAFVRRRIRAGDLIPIQEKRP
ncbi:MAG: hypothetical protein AB7O24_04270 [Kofleriaceae bacterium]